MTQRASRSIAVQLNAAQTIIGNTLANPEILERVTTYGYTAEKMQDGVQLHDAALAANNAQAAAAGAQHEATAALKAAERQARKAYQELAKVARAVFVNNKESLTALGLNDRMPQALAEFLTVATTLFENARSVAETQAALAPYGFTAARLQEGEAKITALDQANLAQESAKGAAHQAAKDRDAALADLDAWVAKYVKIVRVALSGETAMLDKLGLSPRRSKTTATKTTGTPGTPNTTP